MPKFQPDVLIAKVLIRKKECSSNSFVLFYHTVDFKPDVLIAKVLINISMCVSGISSPPDVNDFVLQIADCHISLYHTQSVT